MRTLATIQTISKLDPIEGKDRIVLASFENIGWHCIVDTSYKIGERVVYVEPDSVLPERPEYEFLRPRCWNSLYKGFRIKSMRMGNVISEGICFRLSDLLTDLDVDVMKDGYDITDSLGIRKYDPETLEEQKLQTNKKYGPFMKFLLRIPFIKNILYPKKKSGRWPDFISKTDETRVQVLSYVFDKYQNLRVYVTEKMDGQSASFFYAKKEFGVCSRNLRLPKPDKIRGKYVHQKSNYWRTAEKYHLESVLKSFYKETGISLCIQGEQAGPGIQGNKYGFNEVHLFVFNIYDITHKRYFSWGEIEAFCEEHDLVTVPFLSYMVFNAQNTDELVGMARGFSVYGTTPTKEGVLREGIVIRSITPMPPDVNMSNMLSFKVINPDFSVKWGANDYSDKT